MPKIKIGIFGAGSMARKHLEAYRDVKGAGIVGVTGARPESLKKIAADFGVRAFDCSDDLLARIDAADICLPTFLHESAARDAAAAGVHTICEKPVALDPRAAARMIAAARSANTILMIAHCLRFWPEYTILRTSVDRGSYGKLLSFHGWRHGGLPSWSSRNWLLDESKSGGPAIDLHIHDANMIFYLLGKPDAVRSSEITTNSVRSVKSEFLYPRGISASAEAGWYFDKNYPFSMGYRAVFEAAVIEYQSDNTPHVTIRRPGKASAHPPLKQTDGYREELHYFVKCIRESCAPSQSSAEDALVSLRMTLAARKSAASGRTVRI